MAGDGDVPFGIWLVDKPAGPTSHGIVAAVRRRLPRGTRVGHAGTLDPFATGLLIVLVGRATRLAPYLSGLDKTYLARVQLGATTVTGDPEAPVEPTGRALPGLAAVTSAVAALPAARRQRVPAYAAVRVDGERLYRRARRGEDVERPEREIRIDSAELRALDADGGWFDLELRCSKGTYVRQIAVDLGEALGCGAYCRTLRRLAVGSLSVDNAVRVGAVGPTGGADPVRALDALPQRDLTGDEAIAVAHGRPVPGDGEGAVKLVAGGRLVAIAHPADDGTLRPRVVLT